MGFLGLAIAGGSFYSSDRKEEDELCQSIPGTAAEDGRNRQTDKRSTSSRSVSYRSDSASLYTKIWGFSTHSWFRTADCFFTYLLPIRGLSFYYLFLPAVECGGKSFKPRKECVLPRIATKVISLSNELIK